MSRIRLIAATAPVTLTLMLAGPASAQTVMPGDTATPSGAAPKGDVISTSPHSGTAALGKKIAIVSSSGKPKQKQHK
jgi:beta-lactam-binding protein with PASTA domain